MSFDINKTLQDMIAAIKGVVKDDWEDIEGYAKQIIEGEKQTLEELAKLRIKDDITDDELKSELDDEKKTVEAQLKALTVLNKAMAQKAANAALDVLFKAIKGIL